MINRKLKQHYRNTPYFSARLQDRDVGKRRDDRYLFCALTNPELVTNWLQAVHERELPVVGIYLLPTVSAGLPEKLDLKQPNLLLVSVHSAGLRLTFFRDQKLRISRLARVDARAANAIKSYAEEISNTRLYLHALRVMTLDEHLSVLIVDRNDTLTDLAQTHRARQPQHRLPPHRAPGNLASLGISAPALESSNDALYLHLLGLRAPDNNLAPANVTLGYRQHQLRRGIYALAASPRLRSPPGARSALPDLRHPARHRQRAPPDRRPAGTIPGSDPPVPGGAHHRRKTCGARSKFRKKSAPPRARRNS